MLEKVISQSEPITTQAANRGRKKTSVLCEKCEDSPWSMCRWSIALGTAKSTPVPASAQHRQQGPSGPFVHKPELFVYPSAL